MAIVRLSRSMKVSQKTLSRKFYGNLLMTNTLLKRVVFMCILNSFTEVDILYFGCMEFKILFDFHKKSQNPVLLL